MIDGYVVSVHDETAGSELDADASATDTTITVVNLADFNEDPDGGTLQITDGTNTESIDFTVPEDSTGEIDLDSALANDYDAGVTRVNVLVNDETIVERWADIRQPDGENLLRSLVPHQLRALLPTGLRDEDAGESESVTAEFEDGDLVIRNVLGKSPTYGEPISVKGISLPETPPSGDSVETSHATITWGNEQLVGSDAGSGLHTITLGVVDGDIANAHLVTLSLEGGESSVTDTSKIWAKVRVGAETVTILDGDGASDFELDESAGWQTWTPTFTGWSSNPSGGVYRYKQTGKTVHAFIRQPNTGTSNATTKTIALPVTAATITNMVWAAPCQIVDNGTAQTTSGQAAISSGASSISFYKDYALGNWTASGSASIVTCHVSYEVA